MNISQTLAQTLALSREMLKMAKQQDATALQALEAKRSALLGALPVTWPHPLPAEAALLRRQIEEILAIDTEALDLLLPWRDQMKTLLGGFETHPPEPPSP